MGLLFPGGWGLNNKRERTKGNKWFEREDLLIYDGSCFFFLISKKRQA